jgi:hypothetical protein
MQSMVEAHNQDLEVNDLQFFVDVYLDQIKKIESNYIDIYNHFANEFGLLQQKVMMKMD